MSDKEKLQAINRLCLTNIGDKHSLTKEIRDIIFTKKKKVKDKQGD